MGDSKGDSKDIRESLCEIISLSFIKEECSAMLSESLTTEAAFFPTKAELSIFISLRVSLDETRHQYLLNVVVLF
jgi:hypothetical protein